MQIHNLTTSPLLQKIPGLKHGFTNLTVDLAQLQALRASTSTVKQVHGDILRMIEKPEHYQAEADAIATFVPNLPIGVNSADCTPVLVAALKNHQTIGILAIHAGWRGTAKQICAKSLAEFASLCPKGALFKAAIGPCISPNAFEVGEEVVQAFPGSLENGLAKYLRNEGERKKFLFDLPGENARQIKAKAAELGLSLEMEVLPLCTFSQEIFPSFRRGKDKNERILSFIQFNEILSG